MNPTPAPTSSAGRTRWSHRAGYDRWRCLSADAGQTTAEYALVLLAAGTIATLVVAWASNNGVVGNFFDQIFERITALVA